MILLRRPLVGLIYGYGVFNEESIELVAWALLWYAAGLVGHCVVEIVSRAFYALHDTRTPVTVGVAAMSLNVALSLAFYQWFAQMNLPAARRAGSGEFAGNRAGGSRAAGVDATPAGWAAGRQNSSGGGSKRGGGTGDGRRAVDVAAVVGGQA